jgi:acyl carrier protein
MALPQPVIDFLNENAQNSGGAPPSDGADLFMSGALDSFALVDFVALLEQHSGIKVPDSDVIAANFQTLDAIERYVDAHRS